MKTLPGILTNAQEHFQNPCLTFCITYSSVVLCHFVHSSIIISFFLIFFLYFLYFFLLYRKTPNKAGCYPALAQSEYAVKRTSDCMKVTFKAIKLANAHGRLLGVLRYSIHFKSQARILKVSRFFLRSANRPI